MIALVIFREIEQLLIHAQELYGRISEVRQASESTNQEKEWLLTELRNTLRSVDWDLDDLSETLTIVERNSSKYGLTKQDLTERRRFVNDSKNLVQVSIFSYFNIIDILEVIYVLRLLSWHVWAVYWGCMPVLPNNSYRRIILLFRLALHC